MNIYRIKNLALENNFILTILIITMAGTVYSSCSTKKNPNADYVPIERDSLTSTTAFLAVYEVLQSPRCLNCHPKGDVPLQGDDSQLHTMLPKRGEDGKGLFAMKCTNCHQDTNSPGLHAPPGNDVWHLPPAEMKMVFEGKSPYELAAQMLDPERNGHKTKEELIKHVSTDDLVLWGWHPGEGRSLPPMPHKDFAAAFTTWIEKGAFLPDSNIPAKESPTE